ncbi:esterase/lipase family protein [candidate division KSB1 bacterium]
MIEKPYYPIIYVRGYAMTMGAVEDTVATPYMGFNLGSTKFRQTFKGEPEQYIFESPFIRLLKDHQYSDAYHNGQAVPEGPVSSRSVWIFRYYDYASKSFGTGGKHEIIYYAEKLRDFILHIRDAVCENDLDKQNFSVYLIAHSMGGLVCRAYLQNPEIPGLDGEEPGHGDNKGVDKFFTYATPHRGIDFRKGLGVLDILSQTFDPYNSGNFEPKIMRKYLGLPNNAELNSLNGQFEPEKAYNLIGTNPSDYNMVKSVIGPKSDGLVQIDNAYVKGAPRAFVYRSHSGHYGIVNSESGYQNLERFLFGDLRASVAMKLNSIDLPDIYPGKLSAVYNIENSVSVRGLPVVLNKRTKDTFSAETVSHGDLTKSERHLFTAFLDTKAVVGENDSAVRYSIHFRIVPMYHIDKKLARDLHFEGQALFDDRLILGIAAGDDGSIQVKYAWQKESMEPDKNLDFTENNGIFTASLPFSGLSTLNVEGTLNIGVSRWNV